MSCAAAAPLALARRTGTWTPAEAARRALVAARPAWDWRLRTPLVPRLGLPLVCFPSLPSAETYKNHRNGERTVQPRAAGISPRPFDAVASIKKPIRNKYMSTKGVDPKFLRNKKYALRGTKKALANARKFKKAE
ncbi:unnamed protein product [Symbiodinium sp. KB8]|nr:unnamed protein product [Symbiodinium sp. KB8]